MSMMSDVMAGRLGGIYIVIKEAPEASLVADTSKVFLVCVIN